MPVNIQLFVKRFFDIIFCSILLIFLFPFLIILALLVKLSSPGSVLFIQERVGRNERPYAMIKFRTMTGQPANVLKHWDKTEENRITAVGRFLRDYGLDELPQLINILKGDMSIVGPRSPLPQQVETFSPHLKKMFKMRPGVLSLAAIAGRRSLTMQQRYELHVEYVEKWSLILDAKIIWNGLFVVLRRESAAEILPKE